LRFSKDDPLIVLKKLCSYKLLDHLYKLSFSNKSRIKSKWDKKSNVVRSWNQIPLVQERVNFRITGSYSETFKDWACKNLFSDGLRRSAISLGCGDGEKELDWAKRYVFQSLVGYDLSYPRIARANKLAYDYGLSEKLKFQVLDVTDLKALEETGEKYDVVIFEHSLHHFSNIDQVLERVRNILKPGGYLVGDEYVGPRRFQWESNQFVLANMILNKIPSKFRKNYSGKNIKNKILYAGEFLMWLNDPSEAVESDNIEDCLSKKFKEARFFYYGGSISHLVFHDIAQNFSKGDAESDQWVKWVLDLEESLIQQHLIQNDFMSFVCRI
jgi:SAM-dependent methyltransferase